MKIQIQTSVDRANVSRAAGALNDFANAAEPGDDTGHDEVGPGERGGAGADALTGAIRALLTSLSERREMLSAATNAGGASDEALPAIDSLADMLVDLAINELRARGGDVLVRASSEGPGGGAREAFSRDFRGGDAGGGQESARSLGEFVPASPGREKGTGDEDLPAPTVALARATTVNANQTELLGTLVSLLSNVQLSQERAIKAIAEATKNAAAQQTLIEDARRSIAMLAMRIGQTEVVNF